MQLAAFSLRPLRYLRENNTQEYSINLHKETPMSLADHADNRRQNPKTQNRNNHNNIPICLSLRDNAACCIPLRNLRYLRENTRKRTQTIRTDETPMSPADLADLRR